jgi:sulfite exporter TauE/SafE
MENIVEIIAILATIALPIGFGMYLGLRSNNQKHVERMELIRQGIIPPAEIDKKSKSKSLRNGMIFLGIGLGFLVSFVINNTFHIADNDQGKIIAGCILFFMGIGYVFYYFYSIKTKQSDEN